MNIDVKPLTSDSNHKKVTPKVTKFKGFSYKRVMVLRAVNAEKSFKIDIAMSYPMLFPDGLKQHVIVSELLFWEVIMVRMKQIWSLLKGDIPSTNFSSSP